MKQHIFQFVPFARIFIIQHELKDKINASNENGISHQDKNLIGLSQVVFNSIFTIR